MLSKNGEPIEMPFRRQTHVGAVNYVSDEGPDAPQEGQLLRGHEPGTPALWAHLALTPTDVFVVYDR